VLARLERYELDVFAEEDAIAAQAAVRTAEAHAAAQGHVGPISTVNSTTENSSASYGTVSAGAALEAAARRAGRRKAVAQASLFDLANQKVVEEVRNADPDKLSPEEAKELLHRLRREMM
ncbi:MAG TPA: hypothetical protein VGJ48_26350, partial [Pyrinomonadaceae bacterium]